MDVIIDSFNPSSMHDPYTAIDMLVKVVDLFYKIEADPAKIKSLSEDLYILSSSLANINVHDLQADIDANTLEDLDNEIDDPYKD